MESSVLVPASFSIPTNRFEQVIQRSFFIVDQAYIPFYKT